MLTRVNAASWVAGGTPREVLRLDPRNMHSGREEALLWEENGPGNPLLNPLSHCEEIEQPTPSPLCLKSFCCGPIFKSNLITADTSVEGSLNTLETTCTFISCNLLIGAVKLHLKCCCCFVLSLLGFQVEQIRKQLCLKSLLQQNI